VHAGALFEVVVVGFEYGGFVWYEFAFGFGGGDADSFGGEFNLVVGVKGMDCSVACAPRVEYRPRGGGARFGFVGCIVADCVVGCWDRGFYGFIGNFEGDWGGEIGTIVSSWFVIVVGGGGS